MGGFDLYGRYYPNVEDAINAETAQCNEIDNENNRREIKRLKEQVKPQTQYWNELMELRQYVQSLEDRISKLESK